MMSNDAADSRWLLSESSDLGVGAEDGRLKNSSLYRGKLSRDGLVPEDPLLIGDRPGARTRYRD